MNPSEYNILSFPGFLFYRNGKIEQNIHKASNTAPIAMQYLTPTLFMTAVEMRHPAPRKKYNKLNEKNPSFLNPLLSIA